LARGGGGRDRGPPHRRPGGSPGRLAAPAIRAAVKTVEATGSKERAGLVPVRGPTPKAKAKGSTGEGLHEAGGWALGCYQLWIERWIERC
jgi:hypothetical protein